ncbi:MAG: hypothetical protein ACUVX1_15300 [Chloroflexota bacterium]
MDLSALHEAVRRTVRDGAEVPELSGAEGRALRSWRRCLKGIEGEITRVVPVAPVKEWGWSPEPLTR